MGWDSKTIHGLQVVSMIIEQQGDMGFKGLLCIRSGQDDLKSISNYRHNGVDLVLSKHGKHLNVDVILDQLANALDSKHTKSASR